MPFRAHVRFDFGTKNNNQYQKLIAAFLEAGWAYVETSAVAVETDDFNVILLELEICARQISIAGTISGLLVDVQRSDSFDGVGYAAAANHPHALQDVVGQPLPSAAAPNQAPQPSGDALAQAPRGGAL